MRHFQYRLLALTLVIGFAPMAMAAETIKKTSSGICHPPTSSYGWDDADRDCQNSRAEALIATSSTTVRFASENRCRVVTGRWISPFTSNIIQNSSEIDIDHVVPLQWAWTYGAKDWPQARREKFANDMANLWPVELSFSKDQYRIGKALLL